MGLAAGLVLIFSAFVFWSMIPRMPDQTLLITPEVITRLEELKPSLNFGPDGYYTGVHNPTERSIADRRFVELIDNLAANLPIHPSKKFVLRQISLALYQSGVWETEDRERAISLCEKIMEAVGVRSSDGLLNRYVHSYPWWLISQWLAARFEGTT